MNQFLRINPEKETRNIVSFLQHTFQKQHIQNAVIGLSGGIDSAVSCYLVTKSLGPDHVYPVHLPYFQTDIKDINLILQNLGIPHKNLTVIPIKNLVEKFKKTLKINTNSYLKIRLGNIMARSRMIILFDRAKDHNAMVCGTENKTEHLLGYFTRFGDQASDIEPIVHLYKTQVYQLAKHLDVSESIIKKEPSANLWQGQTDEDEFGFSYGEADQVLYWHSDKHLSISQIKKKGFDHAQSIIELLNRNSFKTKTPYSFTID